ncbi:hypothetical protein AJ87_37600 [Rhizobium yanglingense]|nr:hypothetical protein AJ87_37600 [Rhizobium yanglingense]
MGLQEGQLIYVALCYSLSFLVAYLATVIIEQPSLAVRDKLFPRKSSGELTPADLSQRKRLSLLQRTIFSLTILDVATISFKC